MTKFSQILTKNHISQKNTTNYKNVKICRIFHFLTPNSSFFNTFALIFCLILPLFNISCSSTKINHAKTSPVYITNSKSINLLQTSEFTQNETKIDVMQLISGTFSNQNFEFLANLQINKNEIAFSLLSHMGTDLGNLYYNNETIYFNSDYFPKNLKAEYIIADIQNAYYPFEPLQQNYKKSSLQFTEEIFFDNNDSDKNQHRQSEQNIVKIRKIYDKNKLIETISTYNDIIQIENNLRGYKYILQTLEENYD